MNDAFSKLHPAVNFAYLALAIVFGFVFLHPAYLAAAFLGAGSFYLMLSGRKGLKSVLVVLPFIAFIALINPVFNTYGSRQLFLLFGRPYTLEALLYGICAAGMLAVMLLWFGCYNRVMTGDKFWGLFGGLAPAISLLLVMVLRLVPSLFRKASQLSGARKSIGKAASEGAPLKTKLDGGLLVLGALTSWALEGGVVTSDSMRARGYGCGKRSSFNIYRFTAADLAFVIVMAVLAAVTIISAAGGASNAEYTPVLNITPVTVKNFAGLAAYTLYVFLPAIVCIKEDIKWRISRSGI